MLDRGRVYQDRLGMRLREKNIRSSGFYLDRGDGESKPSERLKKAVKVC